MLKFVRSHKMLLVNGCFLCFLFLPLSCFCQEKVKVYKVSAKVDASVKESPAVKSKTVFTIKAGDTAAVLDIKGEWVKIFFRDTMSGWVLKDQVEMTEYVAVIQNEELPTDEIIVLNNNVPVNDFAVEDTSIAKTKKTKKQSSSPKKQFSLKEHPYFWYGVGSFVLSAGVFVTGWVLDDKVGDYNDKAIGDYIANEENGQGEDFTKTAKKFEIASRVMFGLSGAFAITGLVLVFIKKENQPKNMPVAFFDGKTAYFGYTFEY